MDGFPDIAQGKKDLKTPRTVMMMMMTMMMMTMMMMMLTYRATDKERLV